MINNKIDYLASLLEVILQGYLDLTPQQITSVVSAWDLIAGSGDTNLIIRTHAKVGKPLTALVIRFGEAHCEKQTNIDTTIKALQDMLENT